MGEPNSLSDSCEDALLLAGELQPPLHPLEK